MVRYPDTITLVTPGTGTWIEGKFVPSSEPATETVECEVQPDNSGFSSTVDGKATVSKYKVFFKNNYSSVTTAKTVIYNGVKYNILKPYITQIDVQLQIG